MTVAPFVSLARYWYRTYLVEEMSNQPAKEIDDLAVQECD